MIQQHDNNNDIGRRLPIRRRYIHIYVSCCVLQEYILQYIILGCDQQPRVEILAFGNNFSCSLYVLTLYCCNDTWYNIIQQ